MVGFDVYGNQVAGLRVAKRGWGWSGWMHTWARIHGGVSITLHYRRPSTYAFVVVDTDDDNSLMKFWQSDREGWVICRAFITTKLMQWECLKDDTSGSCRAGGSVSCCLGIHVLTWVPDFEASEGEGLLEVTFL